MMLQIITFCYNSLIFIFFKLRSNFSIKFSIIFIQDVLNYTAEKFSLRNIIKCNKMIRSPHIYRTYPPRLLGFFIVISQ